MLSGLTAIPALLLAQSPADSDWMSTVWGVALLVIGFSLVIFVHELGHFLAAKWAGVRVQAFAIGFGRPLVAYRKGLGVRFRSTEAEFAGRIDEYLLSRDRQPTPRPSIKAAQVEEFVVPEHTDSPADQDVGDGSHDEPAPREWTPADRAEAVAALGLSETEYRFNWMPLGGYVKMLGQEDFVVDKSGELKVKYDPDSFSNKSVGKRMVIVSAGVIMNLIFAAVAFMIVVMVGQLENPAIVGEVMPDSPAGRAGIQTGDEILTINGKRIKAFRDLRDVVMFSDQDETLEFELLRDGRPVLPRPQVLPEFNPEEKVRQIGVGEAWTRRVRMPNVVGPEKPPADQLQPKDEFYQIVEENGRREVKDIGTVRQALLEARGRPIEVIVLRPKDPEALTIEDCLTEAAQVETTEVRVKMRATMTPVSYVPGDLTTVSFLGLVPRLSVNLILPKKSLDKAGLKAGDVVARIGNVRHPTPAEFREAIVNNPEKPIPVAVSRPDEPNHGLSGAAVRFGATHREAILAAAAQGVDEARSTTAQLIASSELADADRTAFQAALDGFKDAAALAQWLDAIDVHELSPIIPKRPFALFSRPPPKVDGHVAPIGEDAPVVAAVLDKLGERTSPAAVAGIPAGATIVSLDGRSVSRWYEVVEIFAERAGHPVELTYRVGADVKTVAFPVPDCLSAALDLQYGDRVVKIDGQTSCRVERASGKTEEVTLPDRLAQRRLLEERIGKTVQLEYVTRGGKTMQAVYEVREDNVDPWLDRVQYLPTFFCYTKGVWYSESNPIVAAKVGFEQAYAWTMRTIQSIRHIIFTRQVGTEKVSGPLGIFVMGSQIAQSGLTALLWFLGVISANLAVINFLPLPIVDGGLFLFLILEKLRGEPLPIKTQIATQLIGIALIATLFLLVTYQDILNVIK